MTLSSPAALTSTWPPTECAAWDKLAAHADAAREERLAQLFAGDPRRGTQFVARAPGLALDYSRHRIGALGLRLLEQLAAERGLEAYKDMTAIEAMGAYKGTYHILHGNLAPLKGVGPDELRLKELLKRVDSGGIKEVILATGFDSEGEATSAYISKLLKLRALRLQGSPPAYRSGAMSSSWTARPWGARSTEEEKFRAAP